MTVADQTSFDAARVRRESLQQALVGLEDALSTPIGDAARWRLRVAMAVDHAAIRINEHIGLAEAPDGILSQVVTDEPRLCCRADQLRTDHERLERDIDALRLALSSVDDHDVVEFGPAIRNQALAFLGRLVTHRQRGADLVYEAYQVDIGASH